MSRESCATALQYFRHRNFQAWPGLPAGCAVTDVEGVFELSAAYAVGHLGERHAQASFRVASVEGYLEPVRLWYRDDTVVLLTGDYPETTELSVLLAAYGEPQAKAGYHQGVLEIAEGEWMYPERGITLFLNADYSRLAKVAAYAPTSVEDYVAQLSPQERVREFDEE